MIIVFTYLDNFKNLLFGFAKQKLNRASRRGKCRSSINFSVRNFLVKTDCHKNLLLNFQKCKVQKYSVSSLKNP